MSKCPISVKIWKVTYLASIIEIQKEEQIWGKLCWNVTQNKPKRLRDFNYCTKCHLRYWNHGQGKRCMLFETMMFSPIWIQFHLTYLNWKSMHEYDNAVYIKCAMEKPKVTCMQHNSIVTSSVMSLYTLRDDISRMDAKVTLICCRDSFHQLWALIPDILWKLILIIL